MLNELALFLGMIGTACMALDVAKADFLRNLSSVFKLFTKQNLKPAILFKKQFTDEDHKALSSLKKIGIVTSIALVLIFNSYLSDDNKVIEFISYIPFALLISSLIGCALFPKIEKLGALFISIPIYLILPVIYIFLFLSGIVSFLFQLLLKACVSLENNLIGENQAPRFLGLIFLFLSFLLQFIALRTQS
ncbi:hypothetical protein [Pseudoalteromonas luteoviolacea]|uniref:Uncharacterized protein n=1 Tax=Pseudoalteromonas luteoviolacea S4060-1 TaxID=1365257 RepID=A0A167PBJ5_9GAMM|nr:hypothetical protein [Pseudoalteromonas luteoviolacea]KZN70324.1 hypothetical protein N478_00040 [Pseudoalteromonas luteoviolacea S4060-1]